MSSIPEKWTVLAQEDLTTARALLASERSIHVLFFCQQAIEKMLKALIAKRTNQTPPRLHHLMQLAERAGVQV